MRLTEEEQAMYEGRDGTLTRTNHQIQSEIARAISRCSRGRFLDNVTGEGAAPLHRSLCAARGNQPSEVLRRQATANAQAMMAF